MSKIDVKRKPYESPKRAAAARERRRRIRAAASELFTQEGYAATTMKSIAVKARVSERTVYLAFPTKAALLADCIRAAVRGDDEEIPKLAQPSFRAALEAPPDQMLRLLAEASTELMSRAAKLLAIGESVGPEDPEVTKFRALGHAASRADMLDVASALKRAGVLRKGLPAERAADIMYALVASESVYLRLVDQRGWSDQAYARVLEQALAGALGP
jgi:AcrR family transcriptional regulator